MARYCQSGVSPVNGSSVRAGLAEAEMGADPNVGIEFGRGEEFVARLFDCGLRPQPVKERVPGVMLAGVHSIGRRTKSDQTEGVANSNAEARTRRRKGNGPGCVRLRLSQRV